MIQIGGLHLALSRSGVDAQVIEAFDWDQTACQVYRANFGNIVRKVRLHVRHRPKDILLTSEYRLTF